MQLLYHDSSKQEKNVAGHPLNLVYASTPLTGCAICMRCVSGAQLINFPQT